MAGPSPNSYAILDFWNLPLLACKDKLPVTSSFYVIAKEEDISPFPLLIQNIQKRLCKIVLT